MRVFGNGLVIMIAMAGLAAASTTPVDSPAERMRLAVRYVETTHREQIMREVYAEQLRAAWTICHEALCQADLDKAILAATEAVSQRYASNVAPLYAQRLTVRQLSAALKFAQSDEGREIVRAQDAMTDQLAQIGHATALYAQRDVSRQFCPAHPEICVNGLGVKPPQRPTT